MIFNEVIYKDPQQSKVVEVEDDSAKDVVEPEVPLIEEAHSIYRTTARK